MQKIVINAKSFLSFMNSDPDRKIKYIIDFFCIQDKSYSKLKGATLALVKNELV